MPKEATAQAPALAVMSRFEKLPPYDPEWLKTRCRDGEATPEQVISSPGHVVPRSVDPTRDPGFAELWNELSSLLENRDTPPADFPRPILHEGTNRIIDGEVALHVLSARYSDRPIPVRWFEGTEAEAVSLAMGLDKLCSRRRLASERRYALTQWLINHPETSDASLSATFRLHHVSITEIRSQLEANNNVPDASVRIGADGRQRLNPGLAAAKVEAHLKAHPDDLNLPEANLAHSLGVSRGTIRNVKAKMQAEAQEPQSNGRTGKVGVSEPVAEQGFDRMDGNGTAMETILGQSRSAEELLLNLLQAANAVIADYEAADPEAQKAWSFEATPDTIEETEKALRKILMILRPARSLIVS
jgi:hypothetical protein